MIKPSNGKLSATGINVQSPVIATTSAANDAKEESHIFGCLRRESMGKRTRTSSASSISAIILATRQRSHILSFLTSVTCSLLLVVAVISYVDQESFVSAKQIDDSSEFTPPQGTAPTEAPRSSASLNDSSEKDTNEPSNWDAGRINTEGSSHKLKDVNFTQVDEIFYSSLNDTEAIKKWKQMDAQLQEGIKSILKMIFPQIVAISQDAKVSGDCSGGILKWILSLRNLRSWAIRMLDATGKPTSGIFEGSLTMLGNYHQCLSIRSPDEDEIEITEQFEEYFRGRFCVLHFRPWLPARKPFHHLNASIDSLTRKSYKYYEKTLYDDLAEIASAFHFVHLRMDLCVPSTCTESDIQRVADLLSRKLEMRAKVMRCDTEPRDSSWSGQMDLSSWFWCLLTALLVAIPVMVTLIKCCLRSSLLYRRSDTLKRIIESLAIDVILVDRFSYQAPATSTSQIQTNIQCELNNITDKESQKQHEGSSSCLVRSNTINSQVGSSACNQQANRRPLALFGIRNLVILWFLIVQMTAELNYQYLRESLVLRNMLFNYWPFQIIINSSLIFESLITISAFTLGYSCIEWSGRNIIGFLAKRYIRLVLPIATLVTLTILTPLIAINSPVWKNMVENQSTACKSTGFVNLLFLQNFVPYDKMCLPHTWLFCVELQLILLSIPLLALLKQALISTEDSLIVRDHQSSQGSRSLLSLCLLHLARSKGGLVSLVLLVTGIFINFLVVLTDHLPPAWFSTFPEVDDKNFYFSHYLTKTWTHLTAFVVGLLGGHLTRSMEKLRDLDRINISERLSQQQHPSPTFSASSSAPSSSLPKSTVSSTASMMILNLNSQTRTSARAVVSCNKWITISISASIPLAAAAAMCAIIFSTFSWSTQDLPSNLVAALYDSGSRLIWSIALITFMMQISSSHSSPSLASRLLAHPSSVVIGRLSFLAYLISPYIHTFVLAVQEQPLFPSLFMIFHLIVGNIVLTYLAALILAIVIEQPIKRLVSSLIFDTKTVEN